MSLDALSEIWRLLSLSGPLPWAVGFAFLMGLATRASTRWRPMTAPLLCVGTATALAVFAGSLARLGEDKVFETVLQRGHGLEALLAVVLDASPAPLVALAGWMAVGTAIAWSRRREAAQSSLLS